MMPTGPHTETVDNVAFQVEGYPRAWSSWNFELKARWLETHTRPRANRSQVCKILSAHRRARQEALKKSQVAGAAARRAAPRGPGES